MGQFEDTQGLVACSADVDVEFETAAEPIRRHPVSQFGAGAENECFAGVAA